MQTTYAVLAQGTLTGTLADLGTVPSGETWVILSANVCNVTGNVVVLTLALVAATAETARIAIDGRALADQESYLAPDIIGQVLGAGGKIQGLGAGLDFYISGLRLVQ